MNVAESDQQTVVSPQRSLGWVQYWNLVRMAKKQSELFSKDMGSYMFDYFALTHWHILHPENTTDFKEELLLEVSGIIRQAMPEARILFIRFYETLLALMEFDVEEIKARAAKLKEERGAGEGE